MKAAKTAAFVLHVWYENPQYAKTQEECEEKLAELIKTMKAEIAEMKKQAKNA